jgi:CubicO group peptidase (beta-lactamase class C family)
MRNNSTLKLLYTLVFLSSTLFCSAQDRSEKVTRLIDSLHTAGKFNGNIVIAEQGKIMYQKSIGLANHKTGARLNENSLFELASVSKQFTAMGIVMLKQKGKLNYDDPLAKFIPELSFYQGVTIRNLLQHTSGLPDYESILDSLFDRKKIATNQDIIDTFKKYKPALNFEPGTKWKYSNTGYALLGTIIERLSGLSYGAYLEKTIFRPLRMNRTQVYRRRYQPKNIENYAYGYIYVDSLKKYLLPDELATTQYVIYMDGIVGDGTVNSTVIDLLRWDQALYTEKLVPKSALKEIFTSGVLKDGKSTNYGFGWSVTTDSVYGKMTTHTGSWPGYRTIIDRHIDQNKTIIILQNHDKVVNPGKEIRKIMY